MTASLRASWVWSGKKMVGKAGGVSGCVPTHFQNLWAALLFRYGSPFH